MRAEFEIAGKFEEPGSCDALLYAPLKVPLTYRHSRHYAFEFEGSREALQRFVDSCLFDPVSQIQISGGAPWEECAFCLEYGMKKGALDLEKEAILGFYRSLGQPGFGVVDFQLRHRLYVFGEADASMPARFVRDVVNPAIHTHAIRSVAPAV